jgi:hypothetical protein
LDNIDFFLAHNLADWSYIQGLTKTYCDIIPTLYDNKHIAKPKPVSERDGVMVMGCPGTWYNAMPAIKACLDIDVEHIGMPHVGRLAQSDFDWLKQFPQITIYPFMPWDQWTEVLSTYKIGINLMTARAAGSFNLNCAALGLPCIGYDDLDTQKLHSPNHTITRSTNRNIYISNFIELVKEVYYNADYIETYCSPSNYSISKYSSKLRKNLSSIYKQFKDKKCQSH